MLEGVIGLLLFAGTILGMVTGTFLVGIALLTRRWQRALKIGWVLIGWIGIYAALLMVVSLTSQTRYILPGRERCYDEMCYSVQGVKISRTLSDNLHALTAQGNFYILTIRLRSDAKGTAQRPSMPNLFVVDAHGNRYTRILNAKTQGNLAFGQLVTAIQLWDQPVPPGESVLRTVAVDLPVEVRQPRLVITEGIGPLGVIIIGDESSFLHATTQFVLGQ